MHGRTDKSGEWTSKGVGKLLGLWVWGKWAEQLWFSEDVLSIVFSCFSSFFLCWGEGSCVF